MGRKLALILTVILFYSKVTVLADTMQDIYSTGADIGGELEISLDNSESSASMRRERGSEYKPLIISAIEPGEKDKEGKKVDEEDKTGEQSDKSEEISDVTKTEPEKSIVYNVVFPTSIHAYLDPGNLSGSGQIFSNEYVVENYGNTDVMIKIKNVNIHYYSTAELPVFSEKKIKDNNSKIKKINVNMVWENENERIKKKINISEGTSEEYVLLLKAAKYDEAGKFVSISEGSTGTFYFAGTVSANPNINWENDRMKVQFDYELINVEDEVNMPRREK